jgi:very-short-patch-repair endonuclease
MSDQLHNLPVMRDLRQALRRNQTGAEQRLWDALRNRQVGDAKFRRQHSIGYFIVDFYCAEHRLLIEVDGAVHDTPQARFADAEREAALCDLGFDMMRFTNHDVLHRLPYVLDKINTYIAKSPGFDAPIPLSLLCPEGQEDV